MIDNSSSHGKQGRNGGSSLIVDPQAGTGAAIPSSTVTRIVNLEQMAMNA